VNRVHFLAQSAHLGNKNCHFSAQGGFNRFIQSTPISAVPFPADSVEDQDVSIP
jgi:hypothetical protein